MTATGTRRALARYQLSEGTRARVAQRIDGRVASSDVPLTDDAGRVYLIERHVSSQGGARWARSCLRRALRGFGLLSASISWLVSIYPALSRRRSHAYEISLLRAAEAERDLSLGGASARVRRAHPGRADLSAGRGRARPRALPDFLLLLRR